MHMPLFQYLLVLAMMCPSAVALAAGGGGGGSTRAEGSGAEVTRAVQRNDAQRYAEAVALLERYVRMARNDAEGHNWLAYAYRKSGRLPQAFEHHKRALSLVPTHLGAHECIDEAYVEARQPERAELHLRELERIRGGRCEQYVDLSAAIAAYHARQDPTAAKP